MSTEKETNVPQPLATGHEQVSVVPTNKETGPHSPDEVRIIPRTDRFDCPDGEWLRSGAKPRVAPAARESQHGAKPRPAPASPSPSGPKPQQGGPPGPKETQK